MIRETAGIFLFNKDKKMLIVHPTNHPQNVWSIPKGNIELGEDSLSAAIRELKEETSLIFKNIKIDNISEEITMKYRSGKKILKAYIVYSYEDLYNFKFECNSFVYYLNRKKIKKPFPECDKFKWASLEEAKVVLHEAQIRVLNLIIKENDKRK